ncbi:hypothetical protein NDU88_008267 [Pleurodeles waltl]|uniref:Uncharacterized protein n=1 Tax=Pleurodeles waltl TaxID=8319 RepID=A0AAV7PNP2_PLEWA|nr:hypothetical protein NDU88_008267 [Pleurodeles waltl]
MHLELLDSPEMPVGRGARINGERVHSKAGSSVPSGGLSSEELEDRWEARRLKVELAKLKMGNDRVIAMEEKRLAIEERKIILAHELSMKELDLKAQKAEYSADGGSISSVSSHQRLHMPKSLIAKYNVGKDIDGSFEARKTALQMHRIPKEDWGTSLWKQLPMEGRDTLLTLQGEDKMKYSALKGALIMKFGLTQDI